MAASSQHPRSRTASRSTAETAEATHTFEIDGFSLHKGVSAGRFIRSSAFAIGGLDWCVRFYPDGLHRADSNDSCAILLELLREKSQARALYEVRIAHPDGSSMPMFYRRAPTLFSTIHASYSTSSGIDVYKFLGDNNLKKSGHLHGDRLVIECDVTVIKEPQVTEASEDHVPPSDLSANFRELLESEEGADVTFSVQGEDFPAHKIVLAARSLVFKAELYGPLGERNREHITIEDMQPPLFKALLHFVYTDSLPAMEDLGSDGKKEMIMHLLVAADRYAMERLKLICEGILCKSLDVETVATTLSLADQYNCSRLKDACIDYINASDRVNEVMVSQGYLHLKRACPFVFVDMWEKEKQTKSRKI